MLYTLVGNIITINNIKYQRISYFNDIDNADGWVDIDRWDGIRPLYIFSNRELGLDYMGRQVRFESKG